MTHDCRIRKTSASRPLFVFILLAMGMGASLAQGQEQPPTSLASKNVLILHSHEANAPVFVDTDRGLARTLRSGGIQGVHQFFVSLDLRRNTSPEYRSLLVEQMRARSRHCNFSMIVTMYPEALDFVLNDCRDIFPDVPVLAMYLPEGLALPKTGRRIIGHSAMLDISGTFDIALKLVPGAKRVYVVSGSHETDKQGEHQARRDLRKWEGMMEFRYLGGMSFEDILAALAGAPPDTIVLLLTYSQDTAGRPYTSPELTQRLSRDSSAPIFGLLDAALGYGIVGGSLINFERIGDKAGELVLDVLKGPRAGENNRGSLDALPVPMFDWRQMKRWKLEPSRPPRESIVINSEVTFWDFKYHIIGGLALIMAQSFLIAGLLVHRRRRKSAEESLRQKSEELDQFFEVSLDLLCIADTEGWFLRLNPVWERMLGYSREELMAMRFLDFVHPEDRVSTRGAISTLVSQGKVTHFKNRYLCKDGTYRWLEWTSVPAGNLIYAAARDITERMKAEAEERHRRDELAHMTRIAMMGELTTSLAHEINQPLTAILSNAEAGQRFLSGPEPNVEEVRQILEDIIRDDRRAGDVVRKVRSLVKKETPRYEPLDLNEVIQEIVSLIRGDSLLQGLSIATELSPGPARIRGDRTQLQQVILNLFLNGAAAMKNAPHAQREIFVKTAMPDNRTVKASVTDFGVGIDQGNIERLFEPFYTTKTEGLGMGLSISRTIIMNHGGAMEAANNREGGATFSFTLPLQPGDPS